MTSTWGLVSVPALPRSASRCSTPKRCCSSTTTKPRSAKDTLSWIRACVPTTMPAAPLAVSSMACRRCAVFSEPVSSVIRVALSAAPSSPAMARSPSSSASERACCAASTSVGASIAAWRPASTTWSIARSATSVLPEPTSPWSRRFIGCTPDRSVVIAAPTSSWPCVRVNGSFASNRSSRPPSTGGQAGAGRWPADSLRCASTSCTASASSHFSRCSARATSPRSAGLWMRRNDSSSPASLRSRRSDSGSGSSVPSHTSSTWRTHLTIDHDGRPAAAGYTGISAFANSSTVDSSESSSSSWYSGLSSCRLPRKALTLPANRPLRPGSSSRSRHAWLKNVHVSGRWPSVIRTSRIVPRRLRMVRLLARSTWASTVACSPSSRPATSVSSPRSA